jgi:hypothetical protein
LDWWRQASTLDHAGVRLDRRWIRGGDALGMWQHRPRWCLNERDDRDYAIPGG